MDAKRDFWKGFFLVIFVFVPKSTISPAVGAEDSEDEEGGAKAILAAAVRTRDDAWSDAGVAGSDDEEGF